MIVRKIKTNLSFFQQSETEKYRLDTFFAKEPETIAWINSFAATGIFMDVGANVGLYSLYAASIRPHLKIYSIEPSFDNFLRLAQNCLLNKFSNIYPLNIALSNRSGFDRLFCPKDEVGASGAQVATPRDESGNVFDIRRAQPILLQRYKDLNLPVRYLKIDVDGQEGKIMAGMQGNLGSIEQILIEVRKDKVAETTQWARKYGFVLHPHLNSITNHSRHRRALEPGNTAENLIFIKDGQPT